MLVGLDPSWPEQLDCAPDDLARWLDTSDALHAFERGMLSADRFYAELGAHTGCSAHRARLAFCAWVTGPLEGASALLDRLVVPAYAASNTNVDHWACFDPQRVLRSRFTALASHHLGARKPEPAYFARAQAIIGRSPVLFLDDRADNVAAARDAGWVAEQVFGVSECLRVLQDHGLLR